MNNEDIGDPKPLSKCRFEHYDPSIVSAFNQCVIAEKQVTQKLNAQLTEDAKKLFLRDLYHIRLAGYSLVYGVSDAHIAAVTKSILSEADISSLGAFYDQYFIRAFRHVKCRTPQPSVHPSRPSFDRVQEALRLVNDPHALLPYPKNHGQAKEYVRITRPPVLSQTSQRSLQALHRDGHRCMISKKIDIEYWKSLTAEQEKTEEESAGFNGLCNTNCCHIFPELTLTNTNHDHENKLEYAANAWHLLETLGFPSIRTELSGEKIHSLTNILTLEPTLHTQFDGLQLWFEPTSTPNCYNIGTTPKLKALISPEQSTSAVTFQTPDATRFPLPSRTYLQLHAACCKIAHMAGAAEYFSLLEDDDQHDPYAPVPAGALMARLLDLGAVLAHLVILEDLNANPYFALDQNTPRYRGRDSVRKRARHTPPIPARDPPAASSRSRSQPPAIDVDVDGEYSTEYQEAESTAMARRGTVGHSKPRNTAYHRDVDVDVQVPAPLPGPYGPAYRDTQL
ncbi:hypothetical protein EVG20_g9437 [Dentipellis fragilis]|uniref:HNH nuclease domain-containing protein n=1 Tax=Dentipellis fragilis TaxID=205917 RepID=A0A4Y9XXY9_9AGAM|nr:hypothetical protein EVG20_g9437 [Dentipellis fragilis]